MNVESQASRNPRRGGAHDAGARSGIAKTGQQLDARGLDARVEAIEDKRLLLRVAGAGPRLPRVCSPGTSATGRANVTLAGYLFSEKASAYVEARTGKLEGLAR